MPKKTGYIPTVKNQARTIRAGMKVGKELDPRTMDPKLKAILKRAGIL